MHPAGEIGKIRAVSQVDVDKGVSAQRRRRQIPARQQPRLEQSRQHCSDGAIEMIRDDGNCLHRQPSWHVSCRHRMATRIRASRIGTSPARILYHAYRLSAG
jgi:hypothetical protein